MADVTLTATLTSTNVQLTAQAFTVPPNFINYMDTTVAAVEADRVEVVSHKDQVILLEGQAQTSADNAAASANGAANSEDLAGTHATNAGTSADEAAASASGALGSEQKAKAWSSELEDVAVEPGLYSALHHAAKAHDSDIAAQDSAASALQSESGAGVSATAAADSESAAASSATSASGSASTATTKASEASASASAAATSETNAKTSETSAGTSASNAATSEANASASESKADSWANEAVDIAVETGKYSGRHYATKSSENASAASTSASNAATSETNAASSASAAATSASNASTSETNAAASASTASTKATEASTSASNAATSEVNAASSASAAATSETNAANSATDAQASAAAHDSYVLRQALLAEATLSLDFANNRYSVYEGLGDGMTLVPYETALTHTRGSEATGWGVGKLETVGVDAKRLVRDPVTNGSQGLLVEEQRTNLLLWGEDFTNAVWSPQNSSVSSNVQSSPESMLSADKLVENTNDSPHGINQAYGGFTSGVTYTFSVFAKAAERTLVRLSLNPQAFPDANREADFDLTNGDIIRNFGSGASIESFGGGWYRISVTQTADLTASGTCTVYLKDETDNVFYLGDGTSGIYIWGAQLEEGSQPSSYIKTEAAQVTRAADQVSRTLGAEFNASEGTLVLKGIKNISGPVGYLISGGNSANRVGMVGSTTAQVVIGGSPLINATGLQDNGTVSIAFKKGYYRVSQNGAIVAQSDNGVEDFSEKLSSLELSRLVYGSGTYGNGTKEGVYVIPRALSESELIALTTPEA